MIWYNEMAKELAEKGFDNADKLIALVGLVGAKAILENKVVLDEDGNPDLDIAPIIEPIENLVEVMDRELSRKFKSTDDATIHSLRLSMNNEWLTKFIPKYDYEYFAEAIRETVMAIQLNE